ncbi:22711_t:CDS:1, partial [Rhizophagus irregularis]
MSEIRQRCISKHCFLQVSLSINTVAYPTKNTKVFTAELPISLLELQVR